MTTFDSFLEEQLQEPELKAEYDSLEAEFAIMQAIMNARKDSGLIQKKLSEITGINQDAISRLEKESGDPSLRTFQRLATGMNMRLKLEFVKAAE